LEQPRLLLIDANSLINRAFFGLFGRQNLTAPDGTPTGALFAFLNMYLRFAADIQPTHVLAAFDRKEPTFRHQLYGEYKGTRKPMPDDLAAQMPLLRQLLDAMGVSRVDLEGYEADDLIGTYARIGLENGYEVVILTGDKDSFQLIGDRITVVQPVTRNGRTENERYDREAVQSRYGISPEQFVDLKAIMGDPSDNIPGVRGIGEKGAMALIAEYGSLDRIYSSLDQIKKPLAEKLANSREMAYLSRDLSRICQTAPVTGQLDEFVNKPPDQEKLIALMTRYGFRTLLDRMGLKETAVKESTPSQHTVRDVTIPVWTAERLVQVLSGLSRKWQGPDVLPLEGLASGSAEAALDAGTLEPDRVPNADNLIAMELDRQLGALILLPNDQMICVPDARDALKALQDQRIVTAFFDLKQQLRSLGIQTDVYDGLYRARYHDVMISGYLMNDMDGRPDWARLYERLTGEPYPASREQTALEQIDPGNDAERIQAGRSRLAEKVRLIRKAALVQIEKTVQQGISRLTWQVEMPLTPVLAAMEHTGFAIDDQVLTDLNQQFTMRLDELQLQIFELSGRAFNLNSPKQLGDVLFQDLGLSAGKKKASGAYSTDSEELDRLMDAHPIVPLIVEHRQLSKLRSTFLDGLSKMIDPSDKRVHTTLNQAVTATGRLSSTEPNLQNIPIRMNAGLQIRRAFVAAPQHVLLDADYSQIELRLLAHLSGDTDMIQAFTTGQDIHVNTAASLFELPPDQITKEMRAIAKTVNFSIVYGISDFGLARDLGITVKEAHRYIKEYNEHYPGVRAFLDRLVADAYENGYVETMLGRRRYIHELKSPNRNLRSFGERAAMNTPVQGTAADLIKIAMVETERSLRQKGLASRLILQVHDELIVESPVEEASVASVVLKQAMESAMTLKVPLLAEVHQAGSWYDCKMLD